MTALDSASAASWTAAADEAEDREYGTTQADIEAYAEVAGAAAGTALCAAYAAPAVPLCAAAGSAIGGWIAGAVYGLGAAILGRDGPTRGELQLAELYRIADLAGVPRERARREWAAIADPTQPGAARYDGLRRGPAGPAGRRLPDGSWQWAPIAGVRVQLSEELVWQTWRDWVTARVAVQAMQATLRQRIDG